MINRNFVFLSGEYSVTMPEVFRHDNWIHTMSAKRLIKENNLIKREGIFENIKGLIYYNRTVDFQLELDNLNFIIENNIPCWPDPKSLLCLSDRHHVMRILNDIRLIKHKIQIIPSSESVELSYPYVVKIGQDHQGIGKYLVRSKDEELTNWNGLATVEPFFEGRSYRVLFLKDRIFGIEIENPNSWIKNSEGASITLVEDLTKKNSKLINHAKECKKFSNLDIIGIDYIIDNQNEYHFLELNQFPGLNVSDEIVEISQNIFKEKMNLIEKLV